MKTLYIPTTTLNFNNILSSESISPKAFYEQRGFGYNRWSSIPENDMPNAILLYEKPFAFSRPDNGLEDHPLFIEIKADEDFPCVGDGVYYCDHTLYLSPWRARFIFLSDKDMISTESMSKSSIETKMVPLYKKHLVVNHSISGQAPSFTMPDVPLNEKAIDDDWWVNKMKGLLYGYYIGALLSATPESVDRMNTLQEIRNIFSSILSSEHRQPTPIQDERLGELFNKMNYTSPVFNIMRKSLNDDDGKIMDTIRQLWESGCLTNGVWTDKDNMLRLLTSSTSKHNETLAWLEAEESRLKAEMRRQGNPLKVSDEEIITGGKRLTKISDKVLPKTQDRNVTMAWVNDILSSKEYNGKIGTFNKGLSDKLTFKAKDIYGSEWEDSDTKRELNQMRRFIAGAEAEPTWNNGYIPSMAAVLLKGDDWDKLLAFMRGKSMYDYRLAFAFYGELNGFANLTRDFTDVLLTADRHYVADVIKEFNGQVLGDDLFFQDEPISEIIIKNIDTSKTLKRYKNPQEVIEAVRQAGKLELAVQNPKAFMYIIDNLLKKSTGVYKALKKSGFENDTSKYSPEEFHAKIYSIVQPELDKLKGKKKDEKMQEYKEKIDKAIDLESRINDRGAFMYILDNFLKPTDKAYKAIAKMVKGEIGGEKTTARAREQSLNFPEDDGSGTMEEGRNTVAGGEILFINDVNASAFIEQRDYLPEDMRRDIIGNLRAFQYSYRSGYYYRNRNQYRRNNGDTIDHFIKVCFNPGTPNERIGMKSVRDRNDSSKLMDRLKEDLMQRYHVRQGEDKTGQR